MAERDSNYAGSVTLRYEYCPSGDPEGGFFPDEGNVIHVSYKFDIDPTAGIRCQVTKFVDFLRAQGWSPESILATIDTVLDDVQAALDSREAG